MTNPRVWAKLHKTDFAKSLIAESGATPDGNPTAIFMAGLPGAGKTELSKALVHVLGNKIVRLDMDEIASRIDGYKPENANLFRGAASELLNKTFDLTVHEKLDFIMDGTFGSKNAKKNIQRVLKHGYRTKIIYVRQDPRLAWIFTQEREKLEHRAIDEEGFIKAYFNTLQNLKDILNEFSTSVTLDIVTKDKYNKITEWIGGTIFNQITELETIHYDETTLRSYIND